MRSRSKRLISLLMPALLVLVFSACQFGTSKKPPLEYMPDMQDSPAVKAQREPMRLPPEGTIPRGFDPYPYAADQGDAAGAALINPLPRNKATLVKGQQLYNTYCAVCHGPKAKGDGPIIPKFPFAPALHTDKVRDWSDGRLFHVITKGQNLMPGYATQIFPDERWAIVHYLRALQRAVNPTPEDLEVYEKLGGK